MSQVNWLSETSCGVPAFDRLHFKIFTALNELSSAQDDDFSSIFNRFVAQVEQAFRMEEQWMEEIEFPAFRLHQEQHARLLSGLHHVHGCVMAGDIETGRNVADNLMPQWLAFHTSTLDVALAAAMQITPFETPLPASHKNRFMSDSSNFAASTQVPHEPVKHHD
jgi:hemerythrin-like metal-binding protein